ncbi:MAG: OmpA family protein [Proteobacteria bacterium]|nr:OmpA family protein [Pseudomonadota bacterium]MBU6426111.1 OmpA family protein [Rhodospirillales bacterium]
MAGMKLPAKKKKPEAHANHERWIISYADLLTLLLATFVVLYASSTRNKFKQEEITKAFIEAFHGSPPAVIVSHPSGSRGVLQHQVSPIPKRVESPSSADAKIPQKMARQLARDIQTLQQLQLKLDALFQPMIEKNQVAISNAPLTLTIKLDASVLFDSGDATLKPEAVTLLSQVGAGLTKLPAGYRITVQGYTDNKPIATAQFPSNWSLSVERAVAVVQLFVGNGVGGTILAAEGFGEFSPIASNDTAAGRALNRRVVVVIHAPDPASSAPVQDQPQG